MSEEKNNLKRFVSLVWYDEFIEFLFRFTAKTSEPLLAAGIVYSAADVLSHGSIGGESNPLFMGGFGITQSVAIESSGGVLLVSGIESMRDKDAVKGWLYLVLSSIMAIVGGIMLFMQLAGWQQKGDSPFLLVLFAMRCISSVGFIYLCRTKNIRFKGVQETPVQSPTPEPVQSVQPTCSLEDVRALVLEVLTQAQQQSVQIAEGNQPLQLTTRRRRTTKQVEVTVSEEESETGELPENYYRVQKYLEDDPEATVRDVAAALTISLTTANKWMHRVRELS